uniref:CBM21 domain-containing protein n=1 Tax=Clastoptera arizonana TaxID=38151 RepID=A0A1B6D554_9HEMI
MGNVYPHCASFIAFKLGICFQTKGQEPGQMTTEGGGSKSMIKSRTEDFARHLQKRLRSLSESEDGTWTASEDRPSFDTSSENETFFELDSNITSPEEEITEPDYIPHTNFVPDELLSDNVTTEEPKLTKRDSADEQFYDTIDTSKESSPEIPNSVECPLVKPILINFPIPLCTSKEKNQCASSPDKHLVNGSIYLDADLSSSVNGTCTEPEITECYKNSVIITCNGYVTPSTESTENLSNETCDGLILNHKNLQYHLSEQKDLDDDLVEVNTCTKSCSQIESNCEQQNLENKRNEIKDTMNEQNITKLKSEENVSLTDLLQAIHKELKLEGKQTNGPLSVKNPEINISEVASENSGRSNSKSEEEEEEDIETRRMRFRRCSSLKSGKTPPGTPGRKKIVRFADVLGLDLADVKTFMDEVPTIPNSAYKDLCGVDSSILSTYDPFARISQPMERRERVVIPLFQQPGGHPNFIEKVRELNVCLENAVVTDPSLLAITGTVRVKNIDFHKSVHIRYSLNGWKSFSDLQARYVPNSCDGFSDKFSFLMYAHTLNVGQRLEFAVRFQAKGTQFWDNNGGVNYVFECVSQDNPCIAVVSNVPSSPTEAWPSFY